MEPLDLQHSLSKNLTLECGKIVNDPNLSLPKKCSEISKAVNRVYPGMGDTLYKPIYEFLK